jgi:hypothetical protein
VTRLQSVSSITELQGMYVVVHKLIRALAQESSKLWRDGTEAVHRGQALLAQQIDEIGQDRWIELTATRRRSLFDLTPREHKHGCRAPM